MLLHTNIYIFLNSVSPAQWDLLGTVLVSVLVAVGAAAVFLRGDVETAHLSLGSGLFHTAHVRSGEKKKKKEKDVYLFISRVVTQSCCLRHAIFIIISMYFIYVWPCAPPLE